MHSVDILSRYRTIAKEFVSRWSTDNRPTVVRCLRPDLSNIDGEIAD